MARLSKNLKVQVAERIPYLLRNPASHEEGVSSFRLCSILCNFLCAQESFQLLQIEKGFQPIMPYLAVADGLHSMQKHLGEALETEKLLVQSKHLHFRSPIAFAVLSSAAMRGEDFDVLQVASHHLVEILASVPQQ